MKKTILTFAIIILSISNLKAQTSSDPAAAFIDAGQLAISDAVFSADNLLSQQLRRFNPDIFKMNQDGHYVLDFNNLKGSPYEVSNFSFGYVTDEISKKSVNLYLRYNIYNDEIELKASLAKEEKLIALLKEHDISCTINGKSYHYSKYKDASNTNKKGYLKLVYKGDNYSLYQRLVSNFTPKKVATTGFAQDIPASFSTKPEYYLKNNETLSYIPNKKKSFLRKFNSNSKTLKNYLNKINLKKEGDLINLMKFLDSSKAFF